MQSAITQNNAAWRLLSRVPCGVPVGQLRRTPDHHRQHRPCAAARVPSRGQALLPSEGVCGPRGRASSLSGHSRPRTQGGGGVRLLGVVNTQWVLALLAPGHSRPLCSCVPGGALSRASTAICRDRLPLQPLPLHGRLAPGNLRATAQPTSWRVPAPPGSRALLGRPGHLLDIGFSKRQRGEVSGALVCLFLLSSGVVLSLNCCRRGFSVWIETQLPISSRSLFERARGGPRAQLALVAAGKADHRHAGRGCATPGCGLRLSREPV